MSWMILVLFAGVNGLLIFILNQKWKQAHEHRISQYKYEKNKFKEEIVACLEVVKKENKKIEDVVKFFTKSITGCLDDHKKLTNSSLEEMRTVLENKKDKRP